MIMSLKYYLAEANVFNVAEIKDQLADFASQVSEPYRKSFTKAAFTELTNNEMHQEKITSLPPGSPDWAQAALDRGDLVRSQIKGPIRDQLERVIHWIKDLEAKASSSPSPADSDAMEDRAEANKLLAALPKMPFQAMLGQEEAWWRRARAVDPTNLSGLIKMTDVGGGWTWWKLDSADAYKREGDVLKNCIGKIWTKSHTDNAGQHILVLKDPRGQSHVAMRVHGTEVKEVKGMNNRPPSPAYMGRTNDALTKLGYSVGSEGQNDLRGAGYGWEKGTGIYHISDKFSFEMGPSVGKGLVLVKWTCPSDYWYPSVKGKSMAGRFDQNATNTNRYDLVSPRNTHHPMISMVVHNGKIVAVGNLPNPDHVIKESGMNNLAAQLDESAKALGARLTDELNGRDGQSKWEFDPGLRRYGITIQDGRVLRDIGTAVEMSIRANPRSIATISNPAERLQVSAVTAEPEVILMIDNPTPLAQATAIKKANKPHALLNSLIDKLGRQPDESTVRIAINRDWHSLEKISQPSEDIEMEAIRLSDGFAMDYIAYWRAETGRGAPPTAMQILAASSEGGVDAIKALLTYGETEGWRIEPAVQLAAAKSSTMDEFDLEEIKEALENAGQLDPRVAKVIDDRIAGRG